MRIRTIAINILLPSSIAIATATTWFWATGDTTPTVPTVIGLALTAAGLAAGTEWTARHVAYALRRRGRTARHRKAPQPVSRRLAERANAQPTTELFPTEGDV